MYNWMTNNKKIIIGKINVTLQFKITKRSVIMGEGKGKKKNIKLMKMIPRKAKVKKLIKDIKATA